MSAPRDARSLALHVILEVTEQDAYANLVLPKALAAFRGDTRDKALATEIVYGSLRRMGELDVVLGVVSHRALGDLDPLVLAILRLSVYQIVFLRVPDHAAVDQGVRLAKDNSFPQAAGFINATLRAVVGQPAAHWLATIEKAVHLRQSHPRWISDELEKAWALQEAAGDFDTVLLAHNESPQVTLVCLPGLSEPVESDQRTQWSPLGVGVPAGNPLADPRLRTGLARVQDEGSQLAALLLSRCEPLREGDVIADICAGPGGKTAVLGAEAAIAGATVHAYEKVPHRAALVEDSIRGVEAKHPGVVHVRVADAVTLTGEFDRILLDAPCTGLGALRRRPEARWRKQPEQQAELVALQTRLLTQCLSLLTPGGFLAYVTCSPVVAETSEVVRAVLAQTDGVEMVDTPDVLDRVSRVVVPGSRRGQAVQLWTHLHGTDAMFIQLLRRTRKS